MKLFVTLLLIVAYCSSTMLRPFEWALTIDFMFFLLIILYLQTSIFSSRSHKLYNLVNWHLLLQLF